MLWAEQFCANAVSTVPDSSKHPEGRISLSCLSGGFGAFGLLICCGLQQAMQVYLQSQAVPRGADNSLTHVSSRAGDSLVVLEMHIEYHRIIES